MMQFDGIAKRFCQHGMTLVELLVAITLSALLIGGVLQIYASSSQTYRVQENIGHIQEGGRFAQDVLSRDLRMVGYRGCAGPDIEINNLLNNASAFNWNFDEPIMGFTHDGSNWKPALPTLLNSLVPVPDTQSDILVLRMVNDRNAVLERQPGLQSNTPGSPAASLKVAPGHDLSQFDIVMATDCTQASIFQITGPANLGPTSTTIVHNTGATSVPPGNASTNLGGDFEGGEIIGLVTRVYYVGANAAGELGLYRRDGIANPQELVSGVERMRVQFGEDTSLSWLADEYRLADDVDRWDRVVSARLHLLLRGRDDFLVSVDDHPMTYAFAGGTFTAPDRRLRQVFTTTVGLRNLLP